MIIAFYKGNWYTKADEMKILRQKLNICLAFHSLENAKVFTVTDK